MIVLVNCDIIDFLSDKPTRIYLISVYCFFALPTWRIKIHILRLFNDNTLMCFTLLRLFNVTIVILVSVLGSRRMYAINS